MSVYPHLEYITIDGMVYEAAIMKRDPSGDTYFLRIDHMDDIDRSRMRTILTSRNATRYALWDLLDQTTLPNGENALVYFDQYTLGLTAEGKLFKPSLGKRGASHLTAVQQVQFNAAQAAQAAVNANASSGAESAQAPTAEKKAKKE